MSIAAAIYVVVAIGLAVAFICYACARMAKD